MLDNFTSLFLELNSSGIDAFAQHNWNDKNNYCNPPFAVLGRLTIFLQYDVPEANYPGIAPFWQIR